MWLILIKDIRNVLSNCIITFFKINCVLSQQQTITLLLHSVKTSASPEPNTWQSTTNGRLDLLGLMKRNNKLSLRKPQNTNKHFCKCFSELNVNLNIQTGHNSQIQHSLRLVTSSPWSRKVTRQISNYRSISLLTSFSKVFEKVICKRLYCHINTNKILASEQYGFRSNCSTETAAYNLINNIIEALNSNKWVVGIFCDLTKAFDYVNHNILLTKLEFYGLTGKAKNLIKSYLNDRYQRVRIKNKYFKKSFLWMGESKTGNTTGFGSWPFILSSLH